MSRTKKGGRSPNTWDGLTCYKSRRPGNFRGESTLPSKLTKKMTHKTERARGRRDLHRQTTGNAD